MTATDPFAPRADEDYPDGPWTGFYLQGSARTRQDLDLTFRNGWMTGSGMDSVGRFLIRGRYERDSGEVRWTKSYAGSHDVLYQGYRDGKGIWGTWRIDWETGGFHIWPKGLGSEAAVETEAEQPVPSVSAVPVH
jgi:hypothetical protein